VTTAKRVRLTPEARRAQLIELGVDMLTSRTLDELSVEELAVQAGISRGLLFHYFRSKQDFHLEVVRSMAARLLERTAPDPALDPAAQLRASLAAFVDYITENVQGYLSLVRGAASGDEAMRAVFDETRAAMADRVLANLAGLGLRAGPAVGLAVAGWVAFCEEVVVRWVSGEQDVRRDELLDLLANALPGLVMATVEQPLERLFSPSPETPTGY
jgi:AcrR family transcriptional regulator